MIFGIGTDIVHVKRLAKSIERFGDRFAHRILTQEEQENYAKSKQKPHFLAKRFAAKEAAVKALGIGFKQGVTLQQVRVTHDVHGKPELIFKGKMRHLLNDYKIQKSFLSISDERDYATAVVVLEL